MTHALSIYKFSFPFIEYKYERAIFSETLSDFEKYLKYEDIYVSSQQEEQEIYIKRSIYFKWWRCDFHLNTGKSYYIPKHQYELYFDDAVDINLIKQIIKICSTLWLHNYIFDYQSEVSQQIHHRDIITQEVLQRDFRKFNEKKLQEFLSGSEIRYVSETLKQNVQIRNSFYFMMYNCYRFYQNFRESLQQIQDISDLQEENISIEYAWTLELSSQRLQHINNINITTFKKYSKILDTFFDMLK